MERKLTATLQRDYYGKAKVREENGFIILKSYNTDVCRINRNSGEFERLWSGWSATTAKHINDFLGQYGFPRLSKKEWLALPCVNDRPVYAVSMSNGFVTHTGSALLTAEEAEREAERVQEARPRFVVWYD